MFFMGKSLQKTEISSAHQNWQNKTILLICLILCWRVLYPAISPLDLSPDEAYYWDWSRRLDWGYYSKPPMVAWINWLSTSMFGSNTWAVRLPAALLSTAGLWFVYLTAARLYDQRAGFWAVFASFATPGAAVMSFAMTIDAPMIFAWTASLFFLTQAIWQEDQRKSIPFWLLTGFFVGLGLLTKQTMIAFWLLAFLFFAVSPRHYRLLLTPWPYVAGIITVLMFTPVLIWNSEHGWITFQHTAHHFEPSKTRAVLDLKSFFENAVSQIAILSPLTGGLTLIAGIVSLFSWQRITDKERFLLCFSAIPLLVIAILSFRQGINANWPAPFHVTGLILLAVCSESNRFFQAGWLRKAFGFFRHGVFFGLFLVIMIWLSPWVVTLTDIKTEMFSRVMGWQELGHEVSELMKQHNCGKELFLLSNRRQITSELAFYVKEQPVTYRWTGPERIVKTQYELWPGPPKHDAIFVTYSHEVLPNNLKTFYIDSRMLKKIHLQDGKVFNVYLLKS